jgi:hypothetical protein
MLMDSTISTLTVAFAALLLLIFSPFADAFVITSNPTSRNHYLGSTQVKSQSNDNDNRANDAIGGDLVTALARLDKEWLAQKDGGKKIGEWAVLDVSIDDSTQPEIVYLLEPASGASPSCLMFFLGGAVLGQFPHISYSAFLSRLAAKMNGAVIAIPYEVGLDHFGIAKRAVERMKGAVIECEDKRGYSESLPKYAVGHSLGAKLHCIGMAATGIGQELAGAGFISYNNFGFAETIRMSRSFAKELNFGAASAAMPFDVIVDLAEMAVSAMGLEFTPSPNEMDRILSAKFDDDVLSKTRMFVFDDDDLDSCKGFLQCFENGQPSVSYLPGTHLTPVYLKLGVDDLPDEAREMASAVTGGFRNASFGDEDSLNLLVDEVGNWMMGNGPGKRRPGDKQIAGLIDAVIEE